MGLGLILSQVNLKPCPRAHGAEAGGDNPLPHLRRRLIFTQSLDFFFPEAAMGKTALIVADMLNDFIDPDGSLYVGPSGREIIPFVAGKIETTRRQGGVVIFVCDAHAP